MKKSSNSFLYLFFLITFITGNHTMNNDDIPILGKEDREILEKEVEQELQFRREWKEFLEPIRIDFKKKHARTFGELKEGETIELSDHEVYILGELARDFIRENSLKICEHALETHGFTVGSEEAVRFAYSYGRVFNEWFKEDLLSYLKEERTVYLAMNKDQKKKTTYTLTETVTIEESEENEIAW